VRWWNDQEVRSQGRQNCVCIAKVNLNHVKACVAPTKDTTGLVGSELPARSALVFLVYATTFFNHPLHTKAFSMDDTAATLRTESCNAFLVCFKMQETGSCWPLPDGVSRLTRKAVRGPGIVLLFLLPPFSAPLSTPLQPTESQIADHFLSFV
jgi:hypothetical protein